MILMARPRTISKDDVLRSSMNAFWHKGFEGTSMADLIAATGSTRQSIYGDFGSKDGLYRACFEAYRQDIVEPAIAPLNQPTQGLAGIARYFETQIALAQKVGLPGPGCLVGNAMTETAPNDQSVRELVHQHNQRLADAFANALPPGLNRDKRQELSDFLVIAAQGLWAMSRVTSDANKMRARARTIVNMIQKEIEDAI